MVMMSRISPDGTTLTVHGAHTTDGGKYTCVATNTAGEEDRIFNLNVYGEMIFISARFFFLDFHDGVKGVFLALACIHSFFSASCDKWQQ